MENLLELIITEALINRVPHYLLYEHIYTPHDKTFVKVKQVMENHIRAEEANVTKQGHHCLQKKEFL
jgi:hypothetical protein